MPEITQYDVVVIGAGIQGAGVAQAAAAYGYKTLVIEKFSQAGLGTSSKSSKLIHGGLRYLESRQFKLVRECLQERKILLKNAPDLVKVIPFHIPVYSHSLRSPWMIALGLCVYSIFSFKPFSIIRKSQWHTLDGINTKNLKVVFKYYDAQTDDKKLTQAVIHSAQKLGADIQYNATFIASHIQNNKHHLLYEQNKKEFHIECRCIINCSGPWVINTQEKISPSMTTPKIDLVAGTHIIINQATIQGAYYIEATDKRAVFVIPWKNKYTLIGTTETLFTGQADKVTPSTREKNYLLETYNRYFNKKITHENIVNAFAGLRVLPQNNDRAFNKPRECLIIRNQTSLALITLIGGKLTAYRASSMTVLRYIKERLGEPEKIKYPDTKNIKL